MKRKLRFTIYHGVAFSLALHSSLALPFIIHSFDDPPEEIEPLAFELQGMTAEEQTEEKVLQETKGQAKPNEKQEKPDETAQTPTPPPSNEPQEEPTTDDQDAMLAAPAPSPPSPPVEITKLAEAKSDNSGAANVTGVTEQQVAHKVKMTPEEIDLLRAYVKGLTKKVQSHLVYPDEGRSSGLHGTATVSFAVLADGRIDQASLQVVASSGQPKLDDSAIKTVRASAPFGQPPEAMTISIAVAFGRKSQ